MGGKRGPACGKSKFQIKGVESGGDVDAGDMRLAPHQVVFQESHNNIDNDNFIIINSITNIVNIMIMIIIIMKLAPHQVVFQESHSLSLPEAA